MRTISLYNLLNVKNLLGFNMKSICFHAGLGTKGYPSGLEYGWWKNETRWNIRIQHPTDDRHRALMHAWQGIEPSYNVIGHNYDDGQHAHRHCIKEVHWCKWIYRGSIRFQHVANLPHFDRWGRLGNRTFEIYLEVGQWLGDTNALIITPWHWSLFKLKFWYGTDVTNDGECNIVLSAWQNSKDPKT